MIAAAASTDHNHHCRLMMPVTPGGDEKLAVLETY
jgi:hypothetical protein